MIKQVLIFAVVLLCACAIVFLPGKETDTTSKGAYVSENGVLDIENYSSF